jgi:hypothetical protein
MNRTLWLSWVCLTVFMLDSQISASQPTNFESEYQKIKDTYNDSFGVSKAVLHVLATTPSMAQYYINSKYFVDILIKDLFQEDTCKYYISHNSDLKQYPGKFDSIQNRFIFAENDIEVLSIAFQPFDLSDIDTLFDEDSIMYLEHKRIPEVQGSLWDSPALIADKIILHNKDTIPESLYNDIVLSFRCMKLDHLVPRLYLSRNKDYYYLFFFTEGNEVYLENDVRDRLGTEAFFMIEPFYLIKLIIPTGKGCGCRLIVDRHTIEMYQLQFSSHPPF